MEAILTGKTRKHLVALNEHHFLQAEVAAAFQELQQAAQNAGFSLQIASSFRDFDRQKAIWNNKFTGQRKVHDDHGRVIDFAQFDDWQKCQAILRWSALPGLSRHHWGTEVDIYDPTLLPLNKSLQLEPWEYEEGGYFYTLTKWLKDHALKFGFFFCFLDLPKPYLIGREPWHLSYQLISQNLALQMTPEILLNAWKDEEIAGKSLLIAKLNEIFRQYFIQSRFVLLSSSKVI